MIAVLQAGGDVWFWLIVAVFVLVSKIAGKLKASGETEESPAPPTRPRPAPRRVRPPPPVIPRAQPREWKAKADELQEFLKRVQQPAPPSPPPAKPAPVAQPAPHPRLAEPPPLPPKPAKTPEPALTGISRSAQWTAALRDRQNIRNIIIATEIIGPPKAEQF